MAHDGKATRVDPLRKKYFDAVATADKISDVLFYAGALISLAAPFVVKEEHPFLYNTVFILFGIDVIALFVVSLFSRLYLQPRAQDKRRQEFLASAYDVSLTHDRTQGYYNNALVEPIERLAAQVLENSHFSKAIALRMARVERAKVAIYFVLWAICMLNRSTDLSVVVAASQAVLSEQILSKLIRIEWARMRFESTFDQVHALIQTRPTRPTFDAMAIDYFASYESAKANAGVTLSSRIFEELNSSLSEEWNRIQSTLNIA